ncbi:glycoside hydrolase family 2 protein [Podospora aff. communis PSN243]|uniref:Glycoside hydrolase family 2 protein n=1 Tax=Podospora aff. communis PSN243 TaxID=3040156 RepID=A0AAV9G6L2_9PEZI|nr:glycoside hydrolase family 2 protein [Podospora aff. communis PSN243]
MIVLVHLVLLALVSWAAAAAAAAAPTPGRVQTSLNEGWKFARFTNNPDSLSYNTLKPWILPLANPFIVTGTKYPSPSGSAPGANVQQVQSSFNDNTWQEVDLPHDWAIAGPFGAPGISGGMGRLPTNGIGWYRKTLVATADDVSGTKSIFLDVDGAMSYAAVWLNGNLVGGWPWGYASWRLDLTRHLRAGNNTLAIRLESAVENSRWYPGAGIYRNLWLVKVDKTHVGQWGTQITTPQVSASSATVNLAVQVENLGNATREVEVTTRIYPVNNGTTAEAVATVKAATISVPAGEKRSVNGSVAVANPRLWGPPPSQTPNLYLAVTTLTSGGTVLDTYTTRFGIRSITYSPSQGLLINSQRVYVQGTCNHHDQGAIGAAYNHRATQRQLEILRDMGTNALRTSHNPPAPELLELADEMGFIVLDEAFDCWSVGKTTNDYHLLYPEWHEADLRAFVRRDRNHASVIAWSIGNEVANQEAALPAREATELQNIVHAEDPTRQVTSAMNAAAPEHALPAAVDIIGLNYQGEYGNYAAFRQKFPNKMIWGSETASCISSRGTYYFPVHSGNNNRWNTAGSSDANARYISAYEMANPGWGNSPDAVFLAQERFQPWVAGEFVWTGFDYIGEPTPWGGNGGSRSSYFGIVDLAGFPKDRFYIYQARWRPDKPMVHLLPHWTWPERVGQVTPIHVFSGADEVEVWINGASQGRKKKPGNGIYRFRWDEVKYAAGEVVAVGYKGGKEWGRDVKKTAGTAAALAVTVDRAVIDGDGKDLAYVRVEVVDDKGIIAPRANNTVTFSVAGPGKLVATDNGDPTDMTAFPSSSRKAFSGLALAIVKTEKGAKGQFTVTARADGLKQGQVVITAA